jgi:hypothetical protein
MYSVIEVLPVKESNDHPLRQKRVVSRPAEGWCGVQRAYLGRLVKGCIEDSRIHGSSRTPIYRSRCAYHMNKVASSKKADHI